MTAQVSWTRLDYWRKECGQKFGTISELEIIGSPYDEARKLMPKGGGILDIGSGTEKPLLRFLGVPRDQYSSMDVDPDGDFDFHSFDDIPANKKFDMIVANQVLEHIYVDQAFELLRGTRRHLTDSGVLLATVPNAHHPVRQRSTVMHVVAWPFGDLYGLFRECGYRVVKLARYNKHPLGWNPLKRLVVKIVCEKFRVDWCDSVLIAGMKDLEPQ
jgi:SAM-dependent methyltransferase